MRVRLYQQTITTVLLSSPSASSTSTTTKTRYSRLLSLALLTALFIIPISIASIIYRFNFAHMTSYSLEAVQSSYSVVTVYWGDAPTQGLSSMPGFGILMSPTWSRLSYAALGLCIVLILGCGKDAWRMYRRWFGAVIPRLRARQTSDASVVMRSKRTSSAVSWDRMTGSTVFSSWRSSVTGIAKAVWATASASSLILKAKGRRSSDDSLTNW